MRQTKVLSEEEEKQITELYQSGMSINALYKKYGYSWAIAKRVLDKYEISPRQYEKASEVTQEEVEKVIKLHNEGTTPFQIAKIMNRSYITINRILKKYDWETFQPRGKTDEPEKTKARKASEIIEGTPIDCDTEGRACIYRAPKGCHLCDYCSHVGKLRGGSPHECTKYVFVKRGGRK